MRRLFSSFGTLTSVAASSYTRRYKSSAEEASTASNPLQQLYKSAHKGSGEVPMPKIEKPKGLNGKRTRAEKRAEELFGARSSCSEDAGPVPERALSPLQKRQLLFQNKAAFVLTPQALRRVKYLISQYEQNHAKEVEEGGKSSIPSGIRIGVRRRGCSGYSYTVNYHYDQEKKKEAAPAAGKSKAMLPGLKGDVVVEQENVKVVVDADALFYVIGTEMDYVVRNVEEKFTFKNPNQKYGCGCEESFMPFDEDDLDE
ncbi:iron-sulfur cluster assembly protein [Angomonas deanei]|nr:iron-sulfur cluster assembly protein [Angomonas deanei]EPY42328.1 iron-sulfur cluster assembly protein [Angomonas deanei]|eukprot:EPY34841.1 iron-sulfur cluster assembly protein [Angomonas deanei]